MAVGWTRRHVLVFMGINDIRRGVPAELPIGAYRALIARAHAQGLQAHGARSRHRAAGA